MAARRRTLATAVAGALVILGAGFLAGRAVRSPAQQAADAKGPGPTMLTAPVELRILTAQVTTRADIASGVQRALAPPASATGAGVVTRLTAAPGQPIRPGQVLAEVSGRPVFTLPGGTPAYRDLRPGSTGDDVRQLQLDLRALGFDPGLVDGSYGEPTKRAVTSFYESIGYEPLPSSDSDDQARQEAATAVQQAQWAVDDARAALDQALAAAHGDAGSDPVKKARTTLTRAEQQLTDARTRQEQVSAQTGPIVPLGEYAFIPSFPARVATTTAKIGGAPPTPLLTIAAGQLQATASINPADAPLVRKGQPAELRSDATDAVAKGTVTQVSNTPATADNPDVGARIVVTPTGTWPPSLWGQNLRLTINGATTKGKQLVVPVSALFASADGSTRLTVVTKDDKQRDVTVTVGVHTGGYAAVVPKGGRLAAGDRVLISAENVPAGDGK